MTDTPTIPEGFIPWEGGECPVPGDSFPLVMFGDGFVVESRYSEMAHTWNWRRNLPLRSRIIAYRPDPNYAPPIDWQARAEEAEAKIVELTRRTPLERAQDITPEKLVALTNWCSDKYERTCLSGAAGLDFIAEISKSRDELATLRTKAEKMAAALKPFAKWQLHPSTGGDAVQFWTQGNVSAEKFSSQTNIPTVDNLQCARAALAEWEGKP